MLLTIEKNIFMQYIQKKSERYYKSYSCVYYTMQNFTNKGLQKPKYSNYFIILQYSVCTL